LEGAQIGKKCDVILETFFGDVTVMTSLKWRLNNFLNFEFIKSAGKTTIWSNHGASGYQNWRFKGPNNNHCFTKVLLYQTENIYYDGRLECIQTWAKM